MIGEIALGGSGLGASLLQNYLVQKALEKGNTGELYEDLGENRFNPSQDIARLREAAGVELPITPHVMPQLGNNSVFANVNPNASIFEKAAIGAGPDDPHVMLLSPKAGREILAHELGHAQIAKGQAGRASQYNQEKLVAFSQKANALPIASAIAGGFADDPLEAAMYGVGASLLMDSPQLINEFQANRRAMANLEKAGMSRKGSLGRIAGLYASYPLKAIANGLAGAGLGYVAGQIARGDKA
jgi:hypothetical protein